MNKAKRWVASYERLLDEGEKNRISDYEKEFSTWTDRLLPKFHDYANIKSHDFQRSNRILSIDVEFDNPGILYPAHVPTLENWVVVQVSQKSP
jgi:hypothetical protein